MNDTDRDGNLFSENGKEGSGGIRWDDARVFLAVARTGTLTGAAALLGTGLATVSRRIERLEQALGAPLFSRHQNGYRLSDDGEALVGRAEALEHAANVFGARVEGRGDVVGRVRLATAENLANSLIIPSLPALLDRHPGLEIEVITDIHTTNLHRRDADLAIRMIKPDRGNVTVRGLGELGFGLYGAACYVATRRTDATGFDADRFIGWAETQSHLPAAQWIERILRGRPCALTTTSLSSQLSAASAGLGLAVLPHFLARPLDLVCLLPNLGIDQPIWLAMHSDLMQSRRVRVVADYLSELVLGYRAELRGR